MVAVGAPELTEDHISWLLVTAYNYLQQNLPARAMILLEFLRTFDSQNYQCLKMLAYAYFLQGESKKGSGLIKEVQQLPLTKEELSDMRLLQLKMTKSGRMTSDGSP